MDWTMARRASRMDPSILREVLKLTERPGIMSLAGGLPAPETFPVEAVAEATARVLSESGAAALQYASSEGFGPLREWVSAHLAQRGIVAPVERILITNGSQQALDLVAKALIDPGSQVAVESPTYLGALQAFSPYEPDVVEVDGDDDGPFAASLSQATDARLFYLLPNFQNPTGRCVSAARREELAAALSRLRVPLIEDDPYGDLWYDQEPPPPVSSMIPDQSIYAGSFSKVFSPGLRLGFLVAPAPVYPTLLQAKQACDLHTPGFTQRIVYEVIKDGFLERHVPSIRERYAVHRDAMAEALTRHLPSGCRWRAPEGGMFFWVTLPQGIDAAQMLDAAIDRGVAFIPGGPFFAGGGHANTMRLSFVTVPPAEIDRGVGILASVLAEALEAPRSAALPVDPKVVR